MTTEINPFRITVAAAAARLPVQTDSQLRFAMLLQRGSMSVELYAPQGRDAQTPHRQDELYVVISGSGAFVNGDARHPFGPGDVLFVPAGVEHRFEDFSADFQAWVIFYGPDGGEGSP
jgi:mannose-6-phosphate isomerase-like protein (cupin superfamily)